MSDAIRAKMVANFQALLNYTASTHKEFFEECAREGHAGTELQRRYAACYRTLIMLKKEAASMDLDGFIKQGWGDDKIALPEHLLTAAEMDTGIR